MNDKVPAQAAPDEAPVPVQQWWGYSKEHGWVVLDRSIPCNAPALREDLLFMRCRDATMVSEKRERWVPPAYRFARNHLRELAPGEAAAAAEVLEELQARWQEFERDIHRAWQEVEQRAEASRREAEKARKLAAAELKKQVAAGRA